MQLPGPLQALLRFRSTPSGVFAPVRITLRTMMVR